MRLRKIMALAVQDKTKVYPLALVPLHWWKTRCVTVYTFGITVKLRNPNFPMVHDQPDPKGVTTCKAQGACCIHSSPNFMPYKFVIV